jgi:hypothetical protein
MFNVAMIISSDIENTTMNGLLRQAQRKHPPRKKREAGAKIRPPKGVLMNKNFSSIILKNTD